METTRRRLASISFRLATHASRSTRRSKSTTSARSLGWQLLRTVSRPMPSGWSRFSGSSWWSRIRITESTTRRNRLRSTLPERAMDASRSPASTVGLDPALLVLPRDFDDLDAFVPKDLLHVCQELLDLLGG